MADACNNNAAGGCSAAEGNSTTASGFATHDEGGNSHAVADDSHTEGSGTTASCIAAHAEGFQTQASGDAGHSEGGGSVFAAGVSAHAEGVSASTAGFASAHIMGQNGSANEAVSRFLVNGAIKAKISANTGVGAFTGGTSVGSADYAELFETKDGKTIPPGRFVTLEDDLIRVFSAEDSFVLGITSATPAVLGNTGGFEWGGKYALDEWGRVRYEEKLLPAVLSADGRVIVAERKEWLPVLSGDWHPDERYVPRTEREEWVAVGLLGQLLVQDDGTCWANGCCLPNDEGIASSSPQGYRVMKRTGPNQVLVFFK